MQNLLSSILLSKNAKIKLYKTVILYVVLYRCQTWSLTFREEPRLTVFGKRVLRYIFLLKKDEVTGKWGRSHNEEPYDLYSSPNIIRVIKSRMIWPGQVAIMRDKRSAYRALVGKPERGREGRGRDHLEELRVDVWIILKWNFKTWDVGMNWIYLPQDSDGWLALVNAVMNLPVP